MKIVAAIAVGVVGVTGSSVLLCLHFVGELTFLTLMGLVAVCALIIAFIDRIVSFSLRDLKVELAKVESARKEVEQREKDVRRVAIAIAEITAFLAAFHRRMGSQESFQIETQWLQSRIESLLRDVSIAQEEKAKVLRYLRRVREMDSHKDRDPTAFSAHWDQIWTDIKTEAENA